MKATDEPARDDLLRRLGLDPAVPSKCSLCPYVFTVDSGPFDHATGCAHSKVNRTVGALVEQAVYRGIKSMEPGASRTPVIRHHPLFVETNSNPKLEADIQSIHLGSSVLIDVTFTSKPASSRGISARDRANAAERRKLNEVSKGLEFPPSCFIPMALDNMGTWSDAMLNYFVEAANGQSILPPGTLLHRARILSSLAICEANSLYLQHVRYGRKSRSES